MNTYIQGREGKSAKREILSRTSVRARWVGDKVGLCRTDLAGFFQGICRAYKERGGIRGREEEGGREREREREREIDGRGERERKDGVGRDSSQSYTVSPSKTTPVPKKVQK